MSSVGAGVCTPTHLNAEVWSSMWINDLRLYFNESYSAGVLGYYGHSGLYTTHESVLQSIATPPYFPGFWISYKTSGTLINLLSVTSFKSNANYYPPATNYCSDGYLGCHDNCAKTEACTKREASGKECLLVAMMNHGYDRGYFQAVLDNLDVPAYFCFIGSNGVAQYAADAEKRGAPILFYHYEPDLFHLAHKGLFDRVFLRQTQYR